MKKVLLLITVIVSLNMFSQSCDSALNFCWGSFSPIPMPTDSTQTAGSGPSAPAGPSYGCLGSTPNPTFFNIQIGSSGSIVFYVSGSNGFDIDAICWGPFSHPITVCDSNLSGACGFGTPTVTTNSPCSGNIVDCSYSTSATETITINNAVAGQYYFLLVTNFSDMPQNLVIQQAGGTGTTTCDSSSTSCVISTPDSICFVNTNNSSNNEIYFNHPVSGVKGTMIYRQNALSIWDSIGYVSVNQPDIFIDTVANPNQQKYTYAIAQIDTCGNLHSLSPNHTTILLQSSLGTNGQVNLSWNAYVGVAVSSYYIYRGASPSNMSLLAQVSASTFAYTDVAPLTGNNFYKIYFVAPTHCISNATHDTLVGSNYRSNSTTSIDYINELSAYKLYPNPAKNTVTVYSTEISKSIEITDILGNTVLAVAPQSNTETIDLQSLNKGVYFVKTTNSKGIFCKKLLVE